MNISFQYSSIQFCLFSASLPIPIADQFICFFSSPKTALFKKKYNYIPCGLPVPQDSQEGKELKGKGHLKYPAKSTPFIQLINGRKLMYGWLDEWVVGWRNYENYENINIIKAILPELLGDLTLDLNAAVKAQFLIRIDSH